MGYCTYGGKVVPGNNQAGCVGGGGNWVEDVAPIERNGVQLMHPDSQANASQLKQLSNVTGAGITKSTGNLFKQFTGIPNTAKQVAQKTQQSNIFRGPPQQKLTDIGRIGDVTPTKLQSLDNAVYRAGQYVGQNPIKATAAATGVGVPAYNMFNSEEPITDKKVVQNTIVNQTSPGFTKEQLNARDKAIMQAQNAGNTEGVNALLAGGNPADVAKSDTQLGGKDSMGLLGGDTTAPYTEVPDAKDEVDAGLPSLWENMQKPGYWSEKVEGGSGSWDNRLFRLGEMMSYMGTPLSKRGDNPSKRWTTASTTSNKAATALSKAQATADAKKLKDANYNWKLKEVTDIAGDEFDRWFGTDIPMFGKNKDEQRSRFLSDLTDAKTAYGSSKSLQQVMEDLLAKGDYK